jgi:hypothetical protein
VKNENMYYNNCVGDTGRTDMGCSRWSLGVLYLLDVVHDPLPVSRLGWVGGVDGVDLGDSDESAMAFLFNLQPLDAQEQTDAPHVSKRCIFCALGEGEDEGLWGRTRQGGVVQWYWGSPCWRHPARVLQRHFCRVQMGGKSSKRQPN